MNFLPGNFTRFVRPLLLLLIVTMATASFAAVFISVTVAPPPLPVYVQPPCPEPGFIWTPGYWAWGPFGYYWVPGTWVPAPYPGVYWTPGYWGWDPYEVSFIWHDGYWGPHVGFYGGVNYGFGYFGVGFGGGEWRGDRFYYNRAVWNVNQTRITNVYVNKTVIVNRTENHISYNGGTGGIQRQPTQTELIATRERHAPLPQQQVRHIEEAQRNPQLRVRNNAGRPAVAATGRPGDFKSAVPARATGGRVETTVLNATPKNMPPPRRGPEMQGRAPGETMRGGTPGGPANRPETGGGRPLTPGRPETARPETGGNRPSGGRPEAGRPEAGRPETGGNRPERGPVGRPEAGRPDTRRPETGGGRPFTPSGRPEAGRPETGGNRPERGPGGRPETSRPETGRPETGGGRPFTPSGRPEAGRPETGGNRPERGPGGPPERSVAPPRNEPMRQERERPGAAASQFNPRPERQAPSRPEAAPRNESRPAPQREAPSRGNAPQQRPEKEERGGGHNDNGDRGR